MERQLSWGKMSFSLGGTTAAEVGTASKAVPQLLCGILQFFLAAINREGTRVCSIAFC